MKTSSIILIIVLGVIFVATIILISLFPSHNALFSGLAINTIILLYVTKTFKLFHPDGIPKTIIFQNGEIDKCIEGIHSLFNIALEEVLILSGGLNEKIWGSEIILKDFESFKKRNIRLFIIVGERFEFREDSKLHQFLKQNIGSQYLKFYRYNGEPKNHLVIVDDMHLRLEDKHTIEDEKRKAEIRMYAGSLAGRARQKFEYYRAKSVLQLKEKPVEA